MGSSSLVYSSLYRVLEHQLDLIGATASVPEFHQSGSELPSERLLRGRRQPGLRILASCMSPAVIMSLVQLLGMGISPVLLKVCCVADASEDFCNQFE